MIAEWRLSRPPFKRMSQFSWILYIRDADSADELSGKDLLSTDSVHKARKEVIALKKERDEMVERRYTAKRQKLRNLLKYSHLVNNDVHFSPREPGKCVFIISYVVPAKKKCVLIMYLFWGYTPGCCFLVACL